jgi:protein-disulfide isomerase
VSKQGRRGAQGPGPERARETARQKLAEQRSAQRRRTAAVVTAIVVAVLVAATVVGIAIYHAQSTPSTRAAIPKGGTADGIVVGKPEAKATVDLYVDFLCPYCKQFEETTGPALDRFVAAGTAKVVYHPVAFLDAASAGTRYSTRASNAAACAAEEGVFPQYVRILYANQPAEGSPGLTDDQLIALGSQVGATSPAFADCVRQQRYAGWVATVTDHASKAGVTGTPTVLVNGKPAGPAGQVPTTAQVVAAVEAAAKGP